MAAKIKHVPMRTCVICRIKSPKHNLIRIVATAAGRIELDLQGGSDGRGAYVCSRYDTHPKGLEKDRLERALRNPCTESDWSKLTAQIESIQKISQRSSLTTAQTITVR